MSANPATEIAMQVFSEHLPLYSGALADRRWCRVCDQQFSDQASATAHALSKVIEALDRPDPCDIERTAPYDFAVCTVHDTTFPVDETCEWDGVTSVVGHLREQAVEQRGRAVRAELERGHALQQLAALQSLTGRTECPDCLGAGHDLCDTCDGTGKRGRGACRTCSPAGSGQRTCPTCDGQGLVDQETADAVTGSRSG